MDDRAALLANALNAPADDTARLVLADWLEEHGEEVFGRFVGAGVVAARFRGSELIDDPDYYAALWTLTDALRDQALQVPDAKRCAITLRRIDCHHAVE